MGTFQKGTTYEQTLVRFVSASRVELTRGRDWVEGDFVLTNPAHAHAVRLMKRVQGATLRRTAEGDAEASSWLFVMPKGQTVEHDAPALFQHIALHGMSGDARIAYHRALSADAALLRRVKKAQILA
jgi:hypothetical protein